MRKDKILKPYLKLQDDLDHQCKKLAFVVDTLSQPERSEFLFSTDGQFGLQLILEGVIDEITGISKGLESLRVVFPAACGE